jgi:hypothetical protein
MPSDYNNYYYYSSYITTIKIKRKFNQIKVCDLSYTVNSAN